MNDGATPGKCPTLGISGRWQCASRFLVGRRFEAEMVQGGTWVQILLVPLLFCGLRQCREPLRTLGHLIMKTMGLGALRMWCASGKVALGMYSAVCWAPGACSIKIKIKTTTATVAVPSVLIPPAQQAVGTGWKEASSVSPPHQYTSCRH